MGRKGSMDPEKFSVENHAHLPTQMDMSLLFSPKFFNQCPNVKSRNQINWTYMEKSPSWNIYILMYNCYNILYKRTSLFKIFKSFFFFFEGGKIFKSKKWIIFILNKMERTMFTTKKNSKIVINRCISNKVNFSNTLGACHWYMLWSNNN